MSVNRDKLLEALRLWTEIADSAAANLVISGNKGLACVVGTLRSRGKTLSALAEALETREPNAKDDLEVDWAISTMKWLRDTDWIAKGIGEETITAKGGTVGHRVGLAMLVDQLEAAVA